MFKFNNGINLLSLLTLTRPSITRSKLAIKTLEKGVKYVQS